MYMILNLSCKALSSDSIVTSDQNWCIDEYLAHEAEKHLLDYSLDIDPIRLRRISKYKYLLITTTKPHPTEVGGTNFWVLESESGIMPKPKRIRYWIRDSEKKLNETKSETETKKKP